MAAAAARRRCRRTAAVVQAAARGWGTLRPPDCRLLASAQALGACAHHPASTLDLCVAPTASGTPTPFCARRAFWNADLLCTPSLSEHRAASLGRCQLSGQSVPLGRS
ncbi:hypothetical protein AB1Y20_019962 [Prymnesium parvum]|uniref:Uncharacterized protein n=1 Tax=Prymnesium parvum TaxID=97485 RepID=A0AB34JSA8_PRYPA